MLLPAQELMRQMPKLQHVVLTEDAGLWSTGRCDALLPTVATALQGNNTLHTLELQGDVELERSLEEVAVILSMAPTMKHIYFRGTSYHVGGVAKLCNSLEKLARAIEGRPTFQRASFKVVYYYESGITKDLVTEVWSVFSDVIARDCQLLCSRLGGSHDNLLYVVVVQVLPPGKVTVKCVWGIFP
jgi:hypothetical protein